MNKIKAGGKFLLNVVEVYIPAIEFIILFICFIVGIIFRYVLKNPQSWTFEASSICYLSVGVLSWGLVHRTEEHIAFDMLYEKVSKKFQCVMRILSNFCIATISLVLIYPSIKYLMSMSGLTTQILKIPRWMVFVPFTISFVAAAVRAGYRMCLDIRSFYFKTYEQTYAVKGEETK